MDFSLAEFFSADSSLGDFVVITAVIGGGASWIAGRAIAATWRPLWHLVPYMALLGGAVRFIHFALFQSMFLSLHYYLVDTAVCLLFGLLGFRVKRVAQMTTCYSWLNQREGLLAWRRRPSATRPTASKSG